jgi:hypothetical protein
MLRWEIVKPLRSKAEVYLIDVAQQIYRMHGPEALENYKKQFYDEPEEDNLPMMQIFEDCKVLIDTIPMCIYDDKKIEDIAEFEGDDPIDCLRYGCKTVKRFLMGEIGNMTEMEKRQSILSEYQRDNDTTRMYRRLEAIERQNQSTMNDCLPVSRRSRFARRIH